jgi:hypothetical protein
LGFYRAYPQPEQFVPQAVAQTHDLKMPQPVDGENLLWQIPWGALMRNKSMNAPASKNVGLRCARQPLPALLYLLHPCSRNPTYAAERLGA